MAPSRSSSALLKFLVPAFLILSISYYLFHSQRQVRVPDDSAYTEEDGSSLVPTITKDEFVKNFLEYEIDGPYNGKPLADMCARTSQKIQPGLIIRCGPSSGGMGNVKNIMLNCLRFALEAGAESVVVPIVMARGTDRLLNLWSGHTEPFEYLFDLDHFLNSWETHCPQVRMYRNSSEFETEYPKTVNFTECDFEKLHDHDPVSITLIERPLEWREKFDRWLVDWGRPFSKDDPFVVETPMQLLRWPFIDDPAEFTATYGRLFKIRKDVRTLAAVTLWSLNEKFKLGLELNGDIQQGKFFGAHLRTSADAVEVGWPGYDMQAPNYLNMAEAHNLPLIFLSSGNIPDAERFTATAASKGITVVTKDQLLPDAEREFMDTLAWDHRGMVDYEVLLHSSQFGGMYESSFSWALANRRHVVVGKGLWEPINKETQGVAPDGSMAECWIDRLSAIYGPYDMLSVRWQFPLGLWP